ncbi:alpha-E domain-containing protein [soil metagenome]
MLSRHADAAYWIGRYMERAEATARAIDVHYHFGLESPLIGESMRWSSILAIFGKEEAFEKRHPQGFDERAVLDFFAFDESNPSSIASCLGYARQNARGIRDQISSEMWETINMLYLDYQKWNVDRVLSGSPFEFFAWVKNGSHLFSGILGRTLLMGETRDFVDTGRFLERADQTARILDVKYHDLLPSYAGGGVVEGEAVGVGGAIDVHGWMAVLKSVGAYEAFRKSYRQGVSPSRVAWFLILSSDFPASVRHCAGRVEGCLRRISGNGGKSPSNDADREAMRLYFHLNDLRAEDIILSGLHEFLEDIQERCARIGSSISETYLRY